jgi:hypothetical protein
MEPSRCGVTYWPRCRPIGDPIKQLVSAPTVPCQGSVLNDDAKKNLLTDRNLDEDIPLAGIQNSGFIGSSTIEFNNVVNDLHGPANHHRPSFCLETIPKRHV